MWASWIRPLAEADADCGAKAHGLARLIAAGLPVPEGFVIDRRGFAAMAALDEVGPDTIGHVVAEAARRIASAPVPVDLDREVRARAAQLGRLAVRSSASIEDGEAGAAAGIFTSVTDLAPDDVWPAVRAVWTSALAPLAMAYARRRAAAIAISVIVQRFVPGARMTVYTRAIPGPGGGPDAGSGATTDDELWLERDGQLERVPRSRAADRAETALALAAEAAIGATHGADVELILAAGALAVVQARPIVVPARPTRLAPPPIVLAPLVQDGRRWTWDITHNPDPLSPAQAGLVERVERARASPYALRVCGGYLYTAPRACRSVTAPDATDGAAQPPVTQPLPPVDRAELTARIAAIEARFVLGEPASAVEAVERYVAFMAIWAHELSPLVAAARRRLLDRLARDGEPQERVPALAAALIGPRRVLRDRVMSPAWDVAVPTFAERPAETARPVEPGPVEPDGKPPLPPLPELAAEVELARAAADAADADDLWFARAQWMVRRALLAHGAALSFHDDDVFWLPLDDAISPRIVDPDDARRRASAARAAHARAAQWDMPLVVDGGEPGEHGREQRESAPGLPGGPQTEFRGVGHGSRVIGRVVRFASLTGLGGSSGLGDLGDLSRVSGLGVPRVGRGDVVVTRAITPALAMIVEGCAALVSETGGLLDHGAALARELGIPCVVGCTGAWSQLSDGVIVAVDGDAGLVTTRTTAAG